MIDKGSQSERKERRDQEMRKQPHYEPPGKCSTIRSREESGEKGRGARG